MCVYLVTHPLAVVVIVNEEEVIDRTAAHDAREALWVVLLLADTEVLARGDGCKGK